ncbi:MAG: hypothetical protein ABEH43_09850, partial [Flavobacteriales bacterium]
GSVTLVLSSTGNGVCDTVTDSLEVTITPAPNVDAGSNVYICEGESSGQLNGSVSGGANTGKWSSSGSGVFTPSDTALDATYNLSPSDTSDTLTMYLQSTNNGGCLAVTDSTLMIVNTKATVTAESDTNICTNDLDSIQVNASVSGGSGKGVWTTSGFGSFSPSDTSLNPYYVFDEKDTSQAELNLQFTSVQSCENDSDSVIVDLIPSAIADAGDDRPICSNDSVQLDG